jgi:hypothetical protein
LTRRVAWSFTTAGPTFARVFPPLADHKHPANDETTWEAGDLKMQCRVCPSTSFEAKVDGKHFRLLCVQCEADLTFDIWEGTGL